MKGIKEQKITIKSAIDNYKPPIFWKEKPIIEKQLNKWSLHNLSRSLDNIHFSSILVRKNVSVSYCSFHGFSNFFPVEGGEGYPAQFNFGFRRKFSVFFFF